MAIPEMRALALAGPRASQTQINQFRGARAEFRVLTSPSPKEVADTLAIDRPEVVLIFGGDGTLNRHLNQLAGTGIPVFAVPCGSGNDLARATGTPSIEAALLAWQKFLEGSSEFVNCDLGRIHSDHLAQPRYFSCCANIGLDADAARRTDRLPDWLKSHGGYFLGGLMALARYQPELMFCNFDGREMTERAWFLTVSNTPTYGGGLKIAPQASISDGHLDITFASANHFSRLSLARHFPKIFSGKHIGLTGLAIFQNTHLRIETPSPLPVYADGEFITHTPCQIEIAPQSLRLVTMPVL